VEEVTEMVAERHQWTRENTAEGLNVSDLTVKLSLAAYLEMIKGLCQKNNNNVSNKQ
jgi:hypothetical protein